MIHQQRQRFAVLMGVAVLALSALVTRAPAAHATAPVTEVEPNNAAASAQPLPGIGLAAAVAATIGEPDDEDWFVFDAFAQRTYVVEVYDVASSLAAASGRNCGSSNIAYAGLALAIYGTSPQALAAQCDPNGRGAVQMRLGVTAGLTGKLYIRVLPNNTDVTGGYALRVLPQYDQGATWDAQTLEPNNGAASAAPLTVGLAGARTAAIEPRDPAYFTVNADEDWYQFTAVAQQTYVVELVDVASSLGAVRGLNCGRYTDYAGLALALYDAAYSNITYECEPNGAGNVQMRLGFTAGSSGAIFVRVLPNAAGIAGSYTLRVLPQYNEGATWDAQTLEPNNGPVSAYPLTVGAAHALASRIEPRSAAFYTIAADQDWYWFTGTAQQTYIVELLDVAPSFQVQSGIVCSQSFSDYPGLSLTIYDVAQTPLATQCKPNGAGRVHLQRAVTVGQDGVVFLKVMPNADTLSGTYAIRVRLPSEEFRALLPLIRR